MLFLLYEASTMREVDSTGRGGKAEYQARAAPILAACPESVTTIAFDLPVPDLGDVARKCLAMISTDWPMLECRVPPR